MAASKKSPKLTAAKRRQLPASDFALPGKGKVKGSKGDYPMDTPGRARAAVGRATTNATPAQKKTIKKRVAKKYPEILFSPPKKQTKKKQK